MTHDFTRLGAMSRRELPVQHAEARMAATNRQVMPNADGAEVEPEPEPEPELDSNGGDGGTARAAGTRGPASALGAESDETSGTRMSTTGAAGDVLVPGPRRLSDGGGDDGEDRNARGGSPQYAEVARFLRTIYEQKATEMGNGMTADVLIERMALVWNQRRQKHIAAMRRQQQQQQQQQQQEEEATTSPGRTGTQLSGPEAVTARKQAVLEAAQAKAEAHRRHQAVLAEIRTSSSEPPVATTPDQERDGTNASIDDSSVSRSRDT